jgi:protein-tyrosine phosphatase
MDKYNISYNEIIPGLWLGDKNSSHNTDFLTEKKIKCIINCSVDLPFINDSSIIKKRIPVNDDLSFEANKTILKYLNKCLEFIHENILNNKNILVHCYAGKQRSATIILCYLIKYAKINKNIGVELIKSKREEAFTPGINFEYSINLYCKYLETN